MSKDGLARRSTLSHSQPATESSKCPMSRNPHRYVYQHKDVMQVLTHPSRSSSHAVLHQMHGQQALPVMSSTEFPAFTPRTTPRIQLLNAEKITEKTAAGRNPPPPFDAGSYIKGALNAEKHLRVQFNNALAPHFLDTWAFINRRYIKRHNKSPCAIESSSDIPLLKSPRLSKPRARK